MSQPLKVIIHAQLRPGGVSGGIEQFLIGLIHSLGRLDDSAEEYLIDIGSEQDPDWLKPYLGANQRIVSPPPPQPSHPKQPQRSPIESAKRWLGPLRKPAQRLWRSARRLVLGPPRLPVTSIHKSNGFYESLCADLIHFPYQSIIRCSLPMIFNPHDLQHRHYPQFFTEDELIWRETVYPVGCRSAQAVVVASQWAKDDVVRQYGIAPEKIHVIPMGAPTEMYETVTEKTLVDVQQRFQLPQTFALYPAQTWAHKNHIRLLKAIQLLRDRHGLTVNLVCTGRQNEFWSTIEKHIRKLRLENQVRFLGFVRPSELRAIYHLAQFVVYPSLFEGAGFPVVEAFREGKAVACSTATSLPEYGGGAVLLFDPASVTSIAEAVRRMATDAELRTALRQRGSERVRLLTLERMARRYRALYRQVAGRSLSDEDQGLLVNGLPRQACVNAV